MDTSRRGVIWIDLDNTPHVPFFAPIISELQQRGYALTVTARDAYQVYALADLLRCPHERVGRHFGRLTLLKILGTGLRSLQLLPVVRRAKPDLAVAHGSRSQLLASALLGIPSLSIFDYEFTARLPIGGPTWVMVPDVMSSAAIRFDPQFVLRYPGLKEDVYAPAFEPDPAIRSQLGLDGHHVIVTVRPPATEAHYHSPQSDALFAATMDFLLNAPGTTTVVLPRNQTQEASLRGVWSPRRTAGRMIIPDGAIAGLNLIWHSDLVVSGGGTMNREAAALGVPVYSIFRGTIGDVDRSLADAGRLILVEHAEDIPTKILLRRRTRPERVRHAPSAAFTTIIDHIASLVDGIVSTAPQSLRNGRVSVGHGR